MKTMVATHQFKAFDTEIALCVISDHPNLHKIFPIIEKHARIFQKRFSRFDPSSELSKINRRSKEKISISRPMLEMILRAQKAHKITKGLFDPTILPILADSGYSKSFNLLSKPHLTAKDAPAPKRHLSKNSFQDLLIDRDKLTISAPTDLKIDLGGIAKGYWVDQIKALLDKYSNNYWINAGGDIFIRGKSPENSTWPLAIQNPLALDHNLLQINIPASSRGYGIATSGIGKRQGVQNGKKWHHLIDIRKKKPVKNSILSVTAIAKTTTDADIMAKTILILGIKKGLAFVNSKSDYECVIIDKNLQMFVSDDFKRFL